MLEQNSVVSKKDSMPFWAQFDLVICINVMDQIGYKFDAIEMFRQLGIPARFLMVNSHDPNDNTSENMARARFDWHKQCLKLAFESGCNNVLVFEDNVSLLNNLEQCAFDETTHFIHLNKTWDLFFLGASPSVFFHQPFNVTPCVFKVQSLSTYAYIASRKFMANILNMSYEFLSCPIEHIYHHNMNAYCILPTIFCQSNATLMTKLTMQCKGLFLKYSALPLYKVLLLLAILIFLILFYLLFLRKKINF